MPTRTVLGRSNTSRGPQLEEVNSRLDVGGDIYQYPLHYCLRRSEKFPIDMLKNFQGTLQTDGYVGYDEPAQEDITALACIARARRKFEQALNNDKMRAEYTLKKI
jgi:hypothetical protein